MSLKINPSIFREYDVRGIAGEDLSPEFARALGLAYAHHVAGREPVAGRPRLKIAVGRDCRLTGEEYTNALIEGLRDGGLDVLKIGICPTPLTYFAIFHYDLDGAIMVTGSHNPSNYNGFKIGIGRSTIHGQEIQTLRKIMESHPSPMEERGNVEEAFIIEPYIKYVGSKTGPFKKLKIVLDAGNGTAATVAPPLFQSLGAEIIPLYCELDGNFPNHHPDPTVPENLKDLVAAVKENQADFGVAFDGDSDRIGLVDETGRIIFGDELMVILSRDVLKNNPGATIISEVKSSHRLYEDIKNHGGNPIMWKTGHSLIKSKMKETGAALAGEMSGHIFFADRYFGYDDALYAAVRVFEIASQTEGPVSTLIADLPQVIATPEIRVDCEEEKKFELVEEIKRALSHHNGNMNDIDGIRIDYGEGWGLARASNTQPVLVLRFEAQNQSLLDQYQNEFKGAIINAAKKIDHRPIEF